MGGPTVIATNILRFAMCDYHLLQISHRTGGPAVFGFKRTLSHHQQTFARGGPCRYTHQAHSEYGFSFRQRLRRSKNQVTSRNGGPACPILLAASILGLERLIFLRLIGARKFNFRLL